ncbi:hypothetical protein BEWA_020490 [Theileria equi strain WA]|uniref:Uncharacterized protein n=1 Tax=Theileria equi strain WA TaxID=1537102 RepID=L0AU81_THEEQ|nr:hypothetical protein BEWA_020490 [Theileria equi strain WA]AFZ79202.1 hypothetical protein BEWA_020490 [Theileria equi strain WA]|eukprot:XP_004828868.1 hypothetical protein BEWA_020490 [Theileria equi strain WA]
MYFGVLSNESLCTSLLVIACLLINYSASLHIKESSSFINPGYFQRCVKNTVQISSSNSSQQEETDKPDAKKRKKNLLHHQFDNYKEYTSSKTNLNKNQRWHEIVAEEIAKNRSSEAYGNFSEEKDPSTLQARHNPLHSTIKPDKKPYGYRLSPEGRLKLEDRIENLKLAAHSEPITKKGKKPILWIVRPTAGNYCELLKKDEPKIKSLVKRVRSYFSPDQLDIMVMKLDVKMPLCEILFEGAIPDLVRIFYARGGTLQYYVQPRFWTRCDLLEMDPRLEAKYGKATAPGLFPRWDEDGMVEEIADCMDTRPDYAMEYRMPNAWHVFPMLPEKDKKIMEAYFKNVHWPTRLRVQKAFENGIEDYREIIAEEYRRIKYIDITQEDILDQWLYVYVPR